MSRAGIIGSLTLLGFYVLTSMFWVRPALTGAFLGLVGFAAHRALLARRLLCRHHHRGVQLFRLKRYEAAHAAFDKSAAFFTRWAWLDRHRHLLLGTAGHHEFVSLARYNQAQCLAALGRTQEAVRVLDALLDDRPATVPAIALRNVLQDGCQQPSKETNPDRWFTK
jgi:hypothetical protein